MRKGTGWDKPARPSVNPPPSGTYAAPAYGTVQGRNRAFLIAIAEALQLDKLDPKSWAETKRGITPQAVRQINEAIVKIWPPTIDLRTALRHDDERQVAFFSGDYRPRQLIESVGRHLIYADKVALGDPFQYPFMFREEYSPLLHPEKHLTTTAKNIMVWFQLAKLMDDGLVEIIRLPSDFDASLNRSNFKLSREMVEEHPELKEAMDKLVRKFVDQDNHESREWMLLVQPDWKIVELFHEANPDASAADALKFLAHIHQVRREHPFYIEQDLGHREELVGETTGANVYDCMQIAEINDYYLLTDLDARWQQFKHLQRQALMAPDDRAGVAHGLQNLKLPMARSINVDLARHIREEGQLGRVRGLLNKIMRGASGGDALSLPAAKAFEYELVEAIAEARDEYDQIDRRLLQASGAELVGAASLFGLTGGALSISLGALAAAGALNLVVSGRQRMTFKARYPAAMLMHIPTDD